MTEQPGYLHEFMDFWCARPETEKVWFSTCSRRKSAKPVMKSSTGGGRRVVRDLFDIREKYPKLSMTELTIGGFLNPPARPKRFMFASLTRTITADLKTRVGPCQFGGNPDCSQCGCLASAGLNSIGKIKTPGGIPIERIYKESFKIGNVIAAMRGD
jgi:hypothetical protein